MTKKVVAIVGTYRKGATIDSIVDAMLVTLSKKGVETKKYYLPDMNIEFCINCRACNQEPGEGRGKCIHTDDMTIILDAVDSADGVIIASPVNFGTVTAVTKRFIERLICYAYWPWKSKGYPKMRKPNKGRKALVVSASAAPAFLSWFSNPTIAMLKKAATVMGFKTAGKFFIGLAAYEKDQTIDDKIRRKAAKAALKLL